jgi:hypothetical protein
MIRQRCTLADYLEGLSDTGGAQDVITKALRPPDAPEPELVTVPDEKKKCLSRSNTTRKRRISSEPRRTANNVISPTSAISAAGQRAAARLPCGPLKIRKEFVKRIRDCEGRIQRNFPNQLRGGRRGRTSAKAPRAFVPAVRGRAAYALKLASLFAAGSSHSVRLPTSIFAVNGPKGDTLSGFRHILVRIRLQQSRSRATITDTKRGGQLAKL